MISQISYNGFTFTSDNATLESLVGSGTPEIRVSREMRSNQDGATATGMQYGARSLGWSGHLTSADDPLTAAAYLAERDALCLALNAQTMPLEGSEMIFTLITGDTRRLRYARLTTSVLDFPAGEPSIVWNSYQVVFEAVWPFFEGTLHEDTQPVSAAFGGAAIPAAIPMALVGRTAATLYGSYANAGNARAYPVFTITGPGTGFTVTNRTNGQSFYIDYTLTDGDTIVVDPFSRSVTLNDSTVLDTYFTGDFIYFDPVTTTSLSFGVDSDDTSDTELAVSYYDTYLNI